MRDVIIGGLLLICAGTARADDTGTLADTAKILAETAIGADDTGTVAATAKILASGSGVLESTVITDLVTKAASSAISSGLIEPNPVPQSLTPPAFDTYFATYNATAQSKGYNPRPIELDPRFQANAIKAVEGIRLSAFISPFQAVRRVDAVCSMSGAKITCTTRTPSTNYATVTTPYIDRGNPAPVSAELYTSNGRIIGGTEIKPEDDPFPDSVALVGHNRLCSGALINSDTVVTAAHCLCDGIDEEAIIGTSILSPLSRVKIDKTKSETFQRCDMVSKDLSIGDVALIKLVTKVNVPRKDVSNIKEVRNSVSVRAVGFGRTSNTIGFKYQVNIVIASWQCDGSDMHGIPDKQVYLCKPSYELVAAGLNRDTCNGDSGGAIYIYGEDSKPYIAGITSRAITPTNQCGTGGIYVLLSVPPLREWLASRGVNFKSD